MISRACYVTCDRCGAPGDISCVGAADARNLARGEGFVRLDGQDLCSDCRPAGTCWCGASLRWNRFGWLCPTHGFDHEPSEPPSSVIESKTEGGGDAVR